MSKDRPIVFQGNGYHIVRWDERNFALFLDDEKRPKFLGYYKSIEAALTSLIYNDVLVEEVKHDLKSYVEELASVKQTIVNDIIDNLNI
ncbi:hypothetical protein [Enterococcus cecorum]|uniref:hypothetical protein n=1 Tax=Enterococcus cecorum TaxID=44008 RepID=UPI003265C26C